MIQSFYLFRQVVFKVKYFSSINSVADEIQIFMAIYFYILMWPYDTCLQALVHL